MLVRSPALPCLLLSVLMTPVWMLAAAPEVRGTWLTTTSSDHLAAANVAQRGHAPHPLFTRFVRASQARRDALRGQRAEQRGSGEIESKLVH